MLLLTTVMHTGTTYFYEVLQREPDSAYAHCTWAVVKSLNNYEWIATTWRDPYAVAASWVNRGQVDGKWHLEWFRQWTCYRRIREWGLANPSKFRLFDIAKGRFQHGHDFGDEPKNQYGDRFLLHDALKKGDLEYFFTRVPRAYLEHALCETEGLAYA